MQENRSKNHKKVGILTFHFAHNCGAALQAFALQSVIRKYADCDIIDYQPDYHASWDNYRYKYEYPPNRIRRIWHSSRHKTIALIKIIAHLPDFLKDKQFHSDRKRTKEYELFLSKYTKCSQRCKDEESVRNLASQYDILISGSDQVWNPLIMGNQIDKVYLLPFPDSGASLYSYAASSGDNAGDNEQIELSSFLSHFSKVSVREPELKNLLEKAGIQTRLDVDPTLLIEPCVYQTMEKKVEIHQPFVFIYAFEVTSELEEALLVLKEKQNCTFVSYPLKGAFLKYPALDVQIIDPLGPQEFLWLMHHAEFVVTSTYHGLVFATIYQKQFVCFTPMHGENRIIHYLQATQLMDRYCTQPESLFTPCDYSFFLSGFREQINQSLKFLGDICQ